MGEHSLHAVPGAGTIVPAVWLSFKASKSGAAYVSADADHLYAVVNECVYEWDLVVNTGAQVFHLIRQARCPTEAVTSGPSRRRFFSDALNTFLMPAIPAITFNRIAAAASADTLTATITLKIWYHKFFDKLLEWYSWDGADSNNFANPGDPAPVTSTYRRSAGRYEFSVGTMQMKDVPCILKDAPGLMPQGSRPPVKKLYVYMKVQESHGGLGFTDASKRAIARVFAAADYSKLNRFGHLPTNDSLRVWYRNVGAYIRNYTDYNRGRRLFNEIVAKGNTAAASGSQLQVIRVVRNEIDKHLITCNHWSQARETAAAEAYQLELSKLLGGMTVRRPWAAPIGIYRDEVSDRWSLSDDESAAFVLQMGVAHCGEHATVSFAVLRKIMRDGHAGLLNCVVNCGQSNVDHAFVVGGVRPVKLIHTTAGPRNGSVRPGDPTIVWDLEAALAAAGPGVSGFICDPYLEQFRGDTDISRLTARNLLQVIKRNLGTSARPATRYLAWAAIYPGPNPPTEVRASVPGV